MTTAKTDDCFPVCCLDPCEVLDQILELLPPGPAHKVCQGSNKEKVFKVIADIYSEAIKSDCQMMDEAFPCTATDLVPDWERFLDISCFSALTDLDARRQRLCALLAGLNLVNCSDYVHIASLFGFSVCCEDQVCVYKGIGGYPFFGNCVEAFCPDTDLPAPAPIIAYAYPDKDVPDCLPISCQSTQVIGAHRITITVDPRCSPGLYPGGCEKSKPDQLGVDCTYPDCGISLSDLICIFDRLKPAHLAIDYEIKQCLYGECPPSPEFPDANFTTPC